MLAAQRLFIAVSLAIYFAILIVPGRGVLRRDEARWTAIFLLVLAGLLMLWLAVLIPLTIRFLRINYIFPEDVLMFIARLGLVQALIGILALTAKGLALLIPYAKKYTKKLSELSSFHRTR